MVIIVWHAFDVEQKIKVKFKKDYVGTMEVDLSSKKTKKIVQVKHEIAEKECVSKDHLIFTIHDAEFGSAVILEDEDSLEKWKLDKGGVITCSKGIKTSTKLICINVFYMHVCKSRAAERKGS